MLVDGWARELVINVLDHLLNPLGSALPALDAWDEALSVLCRVPEERLDSLPREVRVCAVLCE